MADAPIQFRPRTRPAPATPPPPPAPDAPARPLPASARKTRLKVDGMTCGNCARNVGNALQSVPGVDFATVDLPSASARVAWKPDAQPDPDALVRALQSAGYPAEAVASGAPSAPGTSEPGNPWRLSLVLGLPLAAVLGIADWGFNLGMNRTFQWVSFPAALLAVAVLGRQFLVGAWNQLRSGGANMDTLVSLGVLAAMGYSVPALLARWPGHLFFTETVTLLALVGTGHFLEHRMSAKAGAALRELLDLAPPTARRLGSDGSESEVPVAELNPGDRIILRPGDRVPVDARVLDGISTADESMLTGESMPVEKSPGAPLYAGTANAQGRLTAEVTATGEETALARIAEVIRRAQSTRASVQRLADRISAVFVPVVVLIALAAAAWWIFAPGSAAAVHDVLSARLWHAHLPESRFATAILVATSVLVIACPCAMGLATPVALMAGVNRAARSGILVRDAAALESCGRIDTLLFDKTGTLTEGRPAVSDRLHVPGTEALCTPADATRIAASIARRSNHPLSRALATLDPTDIPLSSWSEEPGAGLRATLGPRPIRLLSLAALRQAGIDASAIEPFSQRALAQGASIAALTLDGTVVAAFALRDRLRPEAIEVVRNLRSSGIQVGLVSGDHPTAAQAIAAEAGIDPALVRAGVRPEDKAAEIRKLAGTGRRIAFVGDGINDGPALAAADLGIAVARASDVAREAAGLVLLRADLTAVPEALDLARATLRTIRQNLFWAFFYNAAAVPLAALGLLHPALCAAAMGLSDLVVVGNALRLARRPRIQG